jgi:hypothetical protein
MPEQSALRREDQHHIDVIMWDGTYHRFTPRVLDVLLETNRVMKFRRSNGWATVGVDPVRTRRRSSFSELYNGPERRTTH